MMATNLVVPVVLWGPNTPTHCISSVFLSRDQRTLATGCYDGQICLWQIDEATFEMTPRCLLRKIFNACCLRIILTVFLCFSWSHGSSFVLMSSINHPGQ